MAQATWWNKVKSGSKTGFDKAWQAADKLGAPVNRLSNKLGSEAFWPTTLDKESDKAARILKSFCKDGFYAEEDRPAADGPKQKQKVLKKIPTSVIRNAKGLAIFTTMRTGLWVSGAGGSGILIARKEDGSWSPPSGILLHTAGLGFLVGIDIYDCVVVINTDKAMEAFTKLRATLGSEISVAAGPVGAGGILDTELHKRHAPIFTYLKSRGFYAGVQIDGTVVIERSDENERFYGQKLAVREILAGRVRHPPYEVRRLLETVRAAQGDSDVDDTLIPTEAPPGDYDIENGHIFGVPDKEDPDPYGVLALEKEGMSIKEAGTQKRASWEAFSFNPAPNSPVHDLRASHDTGSVNGAGRGGSRRTSWRSSALGNSATPTTLEPRTPSSLRNSVDTSHASIVMTDMATQTDDGPTSPALRTLSFHRRGSSRSSTTPGTGLGVTMSDVPEDEVVQDVSAEKSNSKSDGFSSPPRSRDVATGHTEVERDDTNASSIRNTELSPAPDQDQDLESDHEDSASIHIVEPAVVQTVQTARPATSGAVPVRIGGARIVEVPRRIAPQLPPRNPNRAARPAPVNVDEIPEEAATLAPEQSETTSAGSDHGVTSEGAALPSPTGSKHDSGHDPSSTEEPKSADADDSAEAAVEDARLGFEPVRLEDHEVGSEADLSGAQKENRNPASEEPAEVTSSAEKEDSSTAAAMPGGW